MASFSNNRRRSRSRARSRSRNRTNWRNAAPKWMNSTLNWKNPSTGQEKDITVHDVRSVMNHLVEKEQQQTKTEPLQLTFSCQLAQGSNTIKVTNFSSVKELFEQIAKCFNIDSNDIIFCTINSPKVDMRNLFTGTIEQNDMLFVHVRGQAVEVELKKTEETLGVTIADNGLCRAFLKRIREGTVAAAASPAMAVGQQIESIQGQSVLGLRHYQIAKVIRSIPVGQSFVMRLVNPVTSAFNFLQPRTKVIPLPKQSVGHGMGTIRFKADGGLVVQENGPNKKMIDKMNELFRNYLGVEDDELAQTIWDTAVECKTLQEMLKKVRNSDLQMFDFPDELVFDMWGIISDINREQEQGN